MKKYKLKEWVIPGVYAFLIAVLVGGMFVIGKYMAPDKKAQDIPRAVIKNVIEDDNYNDAVEVVKPTNETVNHPYLHEGVRITKNFYDGSKTDEEQIKSLIYYKNTYMENTGVLYTNDTEFDVVSVLDGTVTSITEDDILGKVVEIMHSNELITIYQCLGDVNVEVGAKVKQNDVIGKSGKANIDEGYENALLFEVNYKGAIINPTEFYNMKISDLMG